jgi:hypothetical protein
MFMLIIKQNCTHLFEVIDKKYESIESPLKLIQVKGNSGEIIALICLLHYSIGMYVS